MFSRRNKLYLAVVLSALIGCNGNYNSGDRVLVDKFAYDAGVGQPRRFEVVVFKFPPTPIENGIPKNYIKRLLGLPGEILAIFFGQIFTYSPDPDEALAFADPQTDANNLWKWQYMHVDSDGLGAIFYDGGGPAKIKHVGSHGPAEKAGLRNEDVITHVGDETRGGAEVNVKVQPGATVDVKVKVPDGPDVMKKIGSADDVWNIVRPTKAGTVLNFKVQRGADNLDLKVTVGPDVMKYFKTPGKMKIVRKPPDVMLAMRRIVNDNDFQPSDFFHEFQYPDGTTPKERKISKRWVPALGSGWLPDEAKGFVHAGDKQDVDWLRYQNVTGSGSPQGAAVARPGHPEWMNKPELINDFMDYNFPIKERGGLERDVPGCNWVGSLMSECRLTVAKAEGEFRMELSRSTFRYQARFDLASGECTLYEIAMNGAEQVLGKPMSTRVKGPGEYNLRFANFDARLTLWVDEDLPFGDGQEYASPVLVAQGEKISEAALSERRCPTKDNDLERPASFGSRGVGVKIHHIRVWRDTYYSRSPGKYDFVDRNNNKTEEVFWRSPDEWTVMRTNQPLIMYVQPGHFLCLGDNSPMSSDSRVGDKDWGLVPQRLMLGRALMVYYPLNRAGPIR